MKGLSEAAKRVDYTVLEGIFLWLLGNMRQKVQKGTEGPFACPIN